MRDAFTIAGCMLKKLFTGWFLFTLVSGLVLVALVSTQSGPEDLEVLLRNCRETAVMITLGMTLLLVIITGSNELPKEVETGVLLFVLAKPVSRDAIVVGKAFGLLGAALISVLLHAFVAVTFLWMRGLPPDWEVYCEFLFTAMRAATIAGIIILVSTTANELATFSVGVVFLGLAFSIRLFDQLIMYGEFGVELVACMRALYYIVPNFSLLSSEAWDSVPVSYLILTKVYVITYTAIAIFIATRLFRLREFSCR